MTSPGRTLAGLSALVAATSVVVQYGFDLAPGARRWLALVDAALAAGFALDLVVVVVRTRAPLAAVGARRFEWSLLALLGVGLGLVRDPGIAEWVVGRMGPWGVSSESGVVVHAYLLASAVLRLLRAQEHLLARSRRPGLILPASFAGLIAVGTLLLSMPRAAAEGRSIGALDALFTATSAACVTGLAVRDVGADFSPLGQAVVLVLMQFGGLGLIMFAAMLSVFSGRSLSVPQLRAVGELVMSHATLGSLRREVKAVAVWAATIEIAGAVLLFFAWPRTGPLDVHAAQSLFHAVSAFCNAGITLTADSLIALRAESAVLAVMAGLIVVGGVGFPVVNEVARAVGNRMRGRRPRRLRVHTRLALVTTGALLVAGTAGFWLAERQAALAGGRGAADLGMAAFQAVTARTAGFSTVAVDALQPATQVLLVVLMAIGAGPVSTGGGIKTVTFAVLLMTVRAMIAGRDRVEVWGRSLPARTIRGAVSVFALYMLAVTTLTFGLAMFDPQQPLGALSFEAVSALSTVGLSTGITPDLAAGSQVLLCLAMFAGRVGPLSLFIVMLGRRERRAVYEFPEEDVVVG